MNDVSQSMYTCQVWCLQALVDANASGIRCLPLAHILRRMIANNNRWHLDGVHTPRFIHACLGKCHLTLEIVVFHIHTCYSRCVQPMTDIFFCWLMRAGHDWCLMHAHHDRCCHSFADVHMWCPHTTSYVFPHGALDSVAPILTSRSRIHFLNES